MDPKKKAKRVGIVFIALFIIAGLVLMYTGKTMPLCLPCGRRKAF